MAALAAYDVERKYTNANLAPGASPYNAELLHQLLSVISQIDGIRKEQAMGILAAILVGQQRADAVPKLFRDIVHDNDPSISPDTLYNSIRQALTIVFPFVGLPHVVPALMGLAAETHALKLKPLPNTRGSLSDPQWDVKGEETRRTIYRDVGNPEVAQTIATWFPEISNLANVGFFGYAIGGSVPEQSLLQSELILVSAIIAIGAKRQARSHIKASLSLGASVETIETLHGVISEVAQWNQTTLHSELEIPSLAEEVRRVRSGPKSVIPDTVESAWEAQMQG